MKVFKTTDKVELKIDELTVEISPLTFDQKCDIQAVILAGGSTAIVKASKLAVKYGVKSIKGLENSDGSEYQVKMDAHGVSDDTIDDIGNTESFNKFAAVCMSLLNGMPKSFDNPNTGEKLDGVSFTKKDEATEKK